MFVLTILTVDEKSVAVYHATSSAVPASATAKPTNCSRNHRLPCYRMGLRVPGYVSDLIQAGGDACGVCW